MSNEPTRWRPDPSGVHELRFFSSDGKPTRLVMDAGRTSYDQTGSDEDDPQNVVEEPPPHTESEGSLSSRPRRIAYAIVLIVLASSVLGWMLVRLHHGGDRGGAHASASTTTTTAAPQSTTTTAVIPTALKPDAESAATALVSSWATGNRAAALTVATPAAVATLFAVPYPSGLAEDRGCSTTFQPIVCTFGPPGGANPNDPIYEVDVSQAPGGWYVSAVKV